MIANAWDAWSSWVAIRLLAGSLQGAVAVAAVWLVCHRCRTIPGSWRARAWWLVSFGLLLSLSGMPRLPMPLLPAPEPSVSGTSIHLAQAQDGFEMPPDAVQASHSSNRAGWVDVALAVWMVGVLVHASRLAASYVSLRGAVRRSIPIEGDDAECAGALARALGLRRAPAISLSSDTRAPLVVGVLRPVVLLPASVMGHLSAQERVMVIGHELAHIRRRDLLFSWVPAIAERLFFFHPLARLAAREYAATREMACDALVLETTGVAPHEYGRLLVRLGVIGMDPVFTVGGSSPSVTALKRRLDMLHDVTTIRSSRATIALVASVALLALLPLGLVARTPAVPQGAAADAGAIGTPQATPPPARRVTPERSLERAIAEQQRSIQQLQEAVKKLMADTATRQAAEQASFDAAQLRARAEYLELEKRMAGAAGPKAERFLEAQLQALTSEQEETKSRLRQVAADIERVVEQLARLRAAQKEQARER